MSGLVAQVVAQLRAATDRLDAIAVAATHAQSDAQEAHGHYSEAATGSTHQDIQGAVNESWIVVEKAGKLGRLASVAAQHLVEYANIIAPGSIPTQRATESALPSGEDIVAQSVEREASRSNVAGFLSKTARKADDLQDQAKQATERLQKIIDIVRGPQGPAGAHTSNTSIASAPPANARPKIEAADAAGNVVIIGLIAGVAIHRASDIIGNQIARFRRRGRSSSE